MRWQVAGLEARATVEMEQVGPGSPPQLCTGQGWGRPGEEVGTKGPTGYWHVSRLRGGGVASWRLGATFQQLPVKVSIPFDALHSPVGSSFRSLQDHACCVPISPGVSCETGRVQALRSPSAVSQAISAHVLLTLHLQATQN